MFQEAAFFALPVTVALRGTLVVGFFALGQGDLAFDHVLFPVQGQGDAGVALLVDGAGEFVDFPFVEQQLTTPGGFGGNVGGRRLR